MLVLSHPVTLYLLTHCKFEKSIVLIRAQSTVSDTEPVHFPLLPRSLLKPTIVFIIILLFASLLKAVDTIGNYSE